VSGVRFCGIGKTVSVFFRAVFFRAVFFRAVFLAGKNLGFFRAVFWRFLGGFIPILLLLVPCIYLLLVGDLVGEQPPRV